MPKEKLQKIGTAAAAVLLLTGAANAAGVTRHRIAIAPVSGALAGVGMVGVHTGPEMPIPFLAETLPVPQFEAISVEAPAVGAEAAALVAAGYANNPSLIAIQNVDSENAQARSAALDYAFERRSGGVSEAGGAAAGKTSAASALFARITRQARTAKYGLRRQYLLENAASLYLDAHVFVDGIDFGHIGAGKSKAIQAQADYLKALGGGNILIEVFFANKTAYIHEVLVNGERNGSKIGGIVKDISLRAKDPENSGKRREYVVRDARSISVDEVPGSIHSFLYVDGVLVAIMGKQHAAKALAAKGYLEALGRGDVSITIYFSNNSAYVDDVSVRGSGS